jgi:hypothetical protein
MPKPKFSDHYISLQSLHFSGGVGEDWNVKTSSFDIHKAMLKAHNLGALLACVKNNSEGNTGETLDANTGLFGGHAYSVTNVVVAQTNDGDQKVT